MIPKTLKAVVLVGAALLGTAAGAQTAFPEHPIRISSDPITGEPRPYIRIRANLEALIDRKSFYRLVEIGGHQGDWFGLQSGGSFFAIIPSAELA